MKNEKCVECGKDVVFEASNKKQKEYDGCQYCGSKLCGDCGTRNKDGENPSCSRCNP